MKAAKRVKPATEMRARTSVVERNTAETRIAIQLTIEGRGQYKVSTGIRFFDHMLELFTRHGAFNLDLKCDGDLDVDQHHTVEDVGIALGEAFDRALGDKRGILRAGYFLMPMDETLAIAAVDLSGRAAFAVDTKVRTRTLVSTTQAARPLRSTAAIPRVSSIGIRKYPARRMPRLSPRARSNASPSAMPTSSTVWC